MCVSSNGRSRGQVWVYYGDTDLLPLKVKTDIYLDDLETGEHISTRMDQTNWDGSIYPELVKRQAPNNLLILKSEMGSDLISKDVNAGAKMYCVQTDNEDIK